MKGSSLVKCAAHDFSRLSLALFRCVSAVKTLNATRIIASFSIAKILFSSSRTIFQNDIRPQRVCCCTFRHITAYDDKCVHAKRGRVLARARIVVCVLACAIRWHLSPQVVIVKILNTIQEYCLRARVCLCIRARSTNSSIGLCLFQVRLLFKHQNRLFILRWLE